MKLVPVFIAATMLLASCASGPSAHQIIGSQLASPNVSFSEMDSTLKRNGYMSMKVKKRMGQYSLVEFANWELVFDGENVAFADELANGKDAEDWMKNMIATNVNNQSQQQQTDGKRIIIID